MKRIVLTLLIVFMSIVVSACTATGVGDYQRSLEFGCTASNAGLTCPGD